MMEIIQKALTLCIDIVFKKMKFLDRKNIDCVKHHDWTILEDRWDKRSHIVFDEKPQFCIGDGELITSILAPPTDTLE